MTMVTAGNPPDRGATTAASSSALIAGASSAVLVGLFSVLLLAARMSLAVGAINQGTFQPHDVQPIVESILAVRTAALQQTRPAPSPLLRYPDRAADEAPFLVAITDFAHRQLLDKFTSQVLNSTQNEVTPFIICLDSQLQQHLASTATSHHTLSPPCIVFDKLARDQEDLWTFRVMLMKMLVDLKIPVLLCDTDVQWLKDPRPLFSSVLQRYPQADFISQRVKWPFALSAKWGATACFGLLYARPTDSAQKVLALTDVLMHSYIADDQAAFNAVLGYLAGVPLTAYTVLESRLPHALSFRQSQAILDQSMTAIGIEAVASVQAPMHIKIPRESAAARESTAHIVIPYTAVTKDERQQRSVDVVLLSEDKAVRYCGKGLRLVDQETTVFAHCFIPKT